MLELIIYFKVKIDNLLQAHFIIHDHNIDRIFTLYIFRLC